MFRNIINNNYLLEIFFNKWYAGEKKDNKLSCCELEFFFFFFSSLFNLFFLLDFNFNFGDNTAFLNFDFSLLFTFFDSNDLFGVLLVDEEGAKKKKLRNYKF